MSWLSTSILILAELAMVFGLIAHVLLRRSGTSETRLAWILLIAILPVVGALAYLLLGAPRGNRQIRRHASVRGCFPGMLRTRSQDLPNLDPDVPRHYQQVFSLIEAVSDTDAMAGHELELLAGGDAFFAQLINDIDAATASCHLLSYIYLDDEDGRRVAEALIRASGRKVACRVLVDSLGSKGFLHSRTRQRMEEAGVQVHEGLPTRILTMLWARMDVRNHRKIVVIDNTIGYIGSQNIASESFAPKARYAPWVDCMVRMHGPGVHDLQELFIEDWYLDSNEELSGLLQSPPAVLPSKTTSQIIGSGPNFRNEALSLAFQATINAAEMNLTLTTPYFVPDQATTVAIQSAAMRGVHTTLILPARNDSKLVALASSAQYEDLLKAGVEIHLFQKGLLHAKTMTVDHQLFMVGSANLDRRSLQLNFEVSLFGWDPNFAAQLHFLQMSYLQQSTALDSTAWEKRSGFKRLACNAAGLLGPLL